MIISSMQLITLRGIFMLILKRVRGLVGTVQNKRTLWRSMFWTWLMTRVVHAHSYERKKSFNWHVLCTRVCTHLSRFHKVMNESQHLIEIFLNSTEVFQQRWCEEEKLSKILLRNDPGPIPRPSTCPVKHTHGTPRLYAVYCAHYICKCI